MCNKPAEERLERMLRKLADETKNDTLQKLLTKPIDAARLMLLVTLADAFMEPRFCERGRYLKEWIELREYVTSKSAHLKRRRSAYRKFALESELMQRLVDVIKKSVPHAFDYSEIWRELQAVLEHAELDADDWNSLFDSIEDCYKKYSK